MSKSTNVEQEKSPDRANRKTGAEEVIASLEEMGVTIIFGVQGGAIMPVYDALYDSKMKHVTMGHEQGAVHAADAYGIVSGQPGVCIATSGPGATNLITGLADAIMDSDPVLALTGQVPTDFVGKDAFQECDTTGITRPCTKHNWLVKDVKDLSKIMHKAFEVATSGRPGPVLVDIPKDIQFNKTKYISYKKSSINKKQGCTILSF